MRIQVQVYIHLPQCLLFLCDEKMAEFPGLGDTVPGLLVATMALRATSPSWTHPLLDLGSPSKALIHSLLRKKGSLTSELLSAPCRVPQSWPWLCPLPGPPAAHSGVPSSRTSLSLSGGQGLCHTHSSHPLPQYRCEPGHCPALSEAMWTPGCPVRLPHLSGSKHSTGICVWVEGRCSTDTTVCEKGPSLGGVELTWAPPQHPSSLVCVTFLLHPRKSRWQARAHWSQRVKKVGFGAKVWLSGSTLACHVQGLDFPQPCRKTKSTPSFLVI